MSLLQVCGALTVIAFHSGVRHVGWGWIAVVLFFALAGRNMAAAVDRTETVSGYIRPRVRRMAVPLAIVWGLVALMGVYGIETHGSAWFLISGPVFLQNLTLPFFRYQFPEDWVFAHLWFVGALLQLQLILLAFRKLLVKSPPLVVVGAVVILGTAFRWLTAVALGGSAGEVDERIGNVLYCLPLTHIEAITLGFLVGRGSLAGLGRHLTTVASVAIGAVLLSAALSVEKVPIEYLGLEFPFRANYMHLWGYLALGLVAASLCSPHNPVAVRVRSLAVPSWLDSGLARMGALTYGAYVFHGTVMVSTTNLHPWLTQLRLRPLGPIIFLVTVVGSFLMAEVARSAIHAIEGVSRVPLRSSNPLAGPASPATDSTMPDM